jgi:DNA-binding LytR/AlgR family response regulator
MIKILLVEDELIIAEDMANILEKMGYEITGSAMDAEEAIECLDAVKPDLVLLDINLGGKKDGVQLAEEINTKYDVPFIFTTSHADATTIERAKKVNPANYLVKPFKREQLYTAIEIAMFNIAKQQEKKPTADTSQEEGLIIKGALFIKEKYRYTKLNIDDILWIKAEGNYLELHHAGKKELIRATLSSFLERLGNADFFRTHKSYAVNLNHLTKFDPTEVTIANTPIPISKQYADELIKRLNVI